MNDALILSIVGSLTVASIVGLVKLYGSFSALKAKHEALQDEVNELKHDVKSDFDKISELIDRRFDRVDLVIDRLNDVILNRRRDDFNKAS